MSCKVGNFNLYLFALCFLIIDGMRNIKSAKQIEAGADTIIAKKR